MPNLSIKGVPEDIAAALRLRAARNHRSLQGELLDLVTRAALDTGEAGASSHGRPAAGSPDDRVSPRPGLRKSIEQIAAEHQRRHPVPIGSRPRATELVRRARDSR